MFAVDTNVVIRLLTEDDAKQVAAARALFQSSAIWISKTVLLEAAWVLDSLYGMEDGAICLAFQSLLGLENVTVEDEPSMQTAFTLTMAGVEFADAIHLSGRPDGAEFFTFDRDLVRQTKRLGVERVSLVPPKK